MPDEFFPKNGGNGVWKSIHQVQPASHPPDEGKNIWWTHSGGQLRAMTATEQIAASSFCRVNFPYRGYCLFGVAL
ncbi:hypothetical protein NPIL_506401 [Nephila pilipes]|uniref:Uncharacterized protein n=1 Tax=Nephila pilipes TaxID=299642 RepID=A0A8X6NI60_NEPPI|nr:hypothetical protein NPIL_506401 [Nephila pilipes]